MRSGCGGYDGLTTRLAAGLQVERLQIICSSRTFSLTTMLLTAQSLHPLTDFPLEKKTHRLMQ